MFQKCSKPTRFCSKREYIKGKTYSGVRGITCEVIWDPWHGAGFPRSPGGQSSVSRTHITVKLSPLLDSQHGDGQTLLLIFNLAWWVLICMCLWAILYIENYFYFTCVKITYLLYCIISFPGTAKIYNYYISYMFLKPSFSAIDQGFYENPFALPALKTGKNRVFTCRIILNKINLTIISVN